MQSILEYAASRALANAVEVDYLPETRPYAIKHKQGLHDEGKGVLVTRQLFREAESGRRVDTEYALCENAEKLDLDKLQEGLNGFLLALKTAKVTSRAVHKIKHAEVQGRKNPVNELSPEYQANATWEAIVASAGRMADLARPLSVQTLAGLLARKLRNLCCNAEGPNALSYEHAALLLLDHFGAATGWLEERSGEAKMLSKTRKPNTYCLTPKFMDEVLGGSLAVDFSERRPMLVPPVPWTTTATHGGYLHAGIQAVRGTNKPIGSPVVVSALNALQGTGFRVNQRVLALAETFTSNAEDMQGKLIQGRYVERRDDVSEDVEQAKTIRSALTISAMRELRDAEEFYFPWNLDWRGRMYPATSIISPQGADLCKGCLEFADGTELGAAGVEALAVYLCNLAGAEKEVIDIGNGPEYRTRTPAERVAWTESHSPLLQQVALFPEANREWHLIGGFGLNKIKRGPLKARG